MTAHQAGGGAHSVLGASGFHRWSKCAPSVNLAFQLGLEDMGKTSSEAAKEGTAAHYMAEQCLENGQDAWEWLGEDIWAEGEHFVVDDEMMESVQLFIDYVNSLNLKGMFVETEVSLDPYLEDHIDLPFPLHGTCDLAGYTDDPEFIIADLKYGKGVRVEPYEGQLKYYALGFLLDQGLSGLRTDMPVRLVVVQPRHDHPNGPIREYHTTVGDLVAWGNMELLPAIEKINDPRARYVAGEHCQFCPVRHACPRIATAFADFAESGEPRKVENEKLAEHLALVKPVRQYIKALDQQAYQALVEKTPVPGYKLVESHGHRTWKDGAYEALKEAAGDEKRLYESKLLTPAKAEKDPALAPVVQQYAYKPVTGWTVAEQDDKREEVIPRSAQDAFAGV